MASEARLDFDGWARAAPHDINQRLHRECKGEHGAWSIGEEEDLVVETHEVDVFPCSATHGEASVVPVR